ncbi:class I SAM-dependent methyltransferase [Desulfobotulus sp. H1]|uniref:Class I SAM-dependent methyltransferase n=1 Tax=Desulfobotulus pelophilus TaxID=2823377 RepID=A0ABT3N8T4_9BACT|nr:class I SAM-dependent methyltransferase [Desulfobotulus pelophilus]MCW7753854.1 class I SAM-dependent methyltransferase [Desulfobotulus pelophilus]
MSEKGILYTQQEARLFFDLLRPSPGDSILDIGCGCGDILESCIHKGLDSTGLEPSPVMLDMAFERLSHRANLFRGYAEDLPFDDNSFNHASLFTTLEFVSDPRKAIEESFRVAKDRVFIGVLNRYAIKGLQRRIQGFFGRGIYAKARFFTLWELKTMVRELAGDVPVTWRSICLFPEPGKPVSCSPDTWPLAQRMPFGTFVGMVVTLKPRFRLRPLALPYPSESRYKESLTGFAAETQKKYRKDT